jgi:hypothetical protein
MTGNGFSWEMKLEDFDSTSEVFQGLWQYVLGSFALAGLVSLSMWIVFYFLFSIFNQKPVVKP